MNATKTAADTATAAPTAAKEPAKTSTGKVISLPQPKPAVMFEVKLADVTLVEERTKLVTLPALLRFEADPAQHAKRKGHQIDPSRFASCMPVMPCMAKLAATGNAYPAEPDDTVVVADERWRPYVKIGHHVHALLIERGELRGRDPAVIKEVLTRAGFPDGAPYADTAVQDALRDLALVGIIQMHILGRRKIFCTFIPKK